MPRILRRVPAKRDIIEHFVFIAEAGGLETAERFLDSVSNTLEELARMPRMGVLRRFRNPSFGDVRMWRVKDFRKYLIFYRLLGDGIEVLRVLHGARDIESLFR